MEIYNCWKLDSSFFILVWLNWIWKSNSEILAGKCLTKLPVGWDYIPWSGTASVTACHPKREWLTNQNGVWLPVLSPVSAHTHPPGPCSFYARLHDIPCARHVGDQYQVKVTESVYCEPYSPSLPAWHPA